MDRLIPLPLFNLHKIVARVYIDNYSDPATIRILSLLEDNIKKRGIRSNENGIMFCYLRQKEINWLKDIYETIL